MRGAWVLSAALLTFDASANPSQPDLQCREVKKMYDTLSTAKGLPDAIFPNLLPPYEHNIDTQNFRGNIACNADGSVSEIRLCVEGSEADSPAMTVNFKKGAGVLLSSTLTEATADDFQRLWDEASGKFKASALSTEPIPNGKATKQFGKYLAEMSLTYWVEMDSASICFAVMTE